ncbi:MAG TPA: TetR family transcriptional regulator [Solirubrobacteraceae bacterium]|nr:TetR family transcriptional regulator [Solirubrobacteraceae bacterium]
MSEGVKSTRRYESSRRREQAEATRLQILQAAQRLFERDGFSATTMAAVAAEAGVAPKTVYIAFETKSGLLRALWHLLLRGDQNDVPMQERRWYVEILREPDPERQLRLMAHNSRIVKLRAGALLKVIRDAASADSEVGSLWSRIGSEFYGHQRGLVEVLHERGHLRSGLDVTAATDRLWTLNHPDLWHLLVGERGWTPEEYEQWCADAACAQLLER